MEHMEEREEREDKEIPEEEKGEKDEKSGESCFKCRLKSFGNLYLETIIGVGAILATAIFLGVKVNVMLGLCLAIVAVCVYAIVVEDGLRRKLGVAYSRVSGGVSLSVIDTKRNVKWDRESRYIPARVMWLDVVALGGRTGKQKADEQVKTVYIPTSVKKIEKNAFEGMTALEKIVYEGTEEQWSEVEMPPLAEEKVSIQCSK